MCDTTYVRAYITKQKHLALFLVIVVLSSSWLAARARTAPWLGGGGPGGGMGGRPRTAASPLAPPTGVKPTEKAFNDIRCALQKYERAMDD